MNVQEIVLPVNSGIAVIGSMTAHLVPGREADPIVPGCEFSIVQVHLAYLDGKRLAYRRSLRFTVSAAVLT